MTYLLPVLILFFLIIFGLVLFIWQAKTDTGEDRGSETKDHSERIYKDFDMYLKVTLGLSAAFGYIRIDKYSANEELAKQALLVVGGIALLTMTVFSIFILCHQGSKIRRWKNIEWPKAIFWQEIWAILAMWVFSSGIWVSANIWV